jgi:hypothetical protein
MFWMVELSTGVSPLGERDGGIVDWSFFIAKGGWWNCQPEFSLLCGGGGMVDLNWLNG